MRKLMIVYGTTEGQTQKIAQFLAQEAHLRDYDCEAYNAEMLPADISPSQFSKIVVAASVHMERHQAAIARFVERYLPDLDKAQALFLSVSLSAAGNPEEKYEAWEYTRQFLTDAGWRPTQVQIVAGALRFSESDFFKRWAMRRLAKEKRADHEHDFEYTDWAELRRVLKDFLDLPASDKGSPSART